MKCATDRGRPWRQQEELENKKGCQRPPQLAAFDLSYLTLLAVFGIFNQIKKFYKIKIRVT